MTELFELIASKPLEFLAGLGVSATSIYTIISLLKGLFSLITKKSKKAKELLNQQNIANAVIEKLGGVEGFMDNVAKLVCSKLEPGIKEIKETLKQIANNDKCPTELKAYIETILKYSGDQNLITMYESLKNQFLLAAQEELNTLIVEGEKKLEEAKEEAKVEQSTETVEKSSNELKKSSKKARKKDIKEEPENTEVDYA